MIFNAKYHYKIYLRSLYGVKYDSADTI